jgi:hypothetical protein
MSVKPEKLCPVYKAFSHLVFSFPRLFLQFRFSAFWSHPALSQPS